ncbi:helix-turn-helix domain-containing protein [Mycobacterium sp. CBMA293]|uniref:helix-turn-helix transcriptional regulator n=1 Tax=unclassified Mycolicibacterium TaxID=2636767 RepID=UPI0012DEFCFA|nr:MULTISPECIES: helix-turn-helix domain-containing protein [unclassified Mycolicibacterium]MUL46758.1 helix-turn-helix domain-containing protein [Mycolicibacterium sp. CBMA 360]MUL57457.1 helix-turn-helix domain-containing protein [Mycolicibacterium sp. CBMA 335]MUL70497.1 helix-turn-helix domain-containing protein [Mycolicibacterium sp. CBMA 311]MUL92545.1 helix-turn-helix domain-containing protein [Mycolicibacterium sp. CBMA 230]MUM04921.1 ArsR family transcriptional regulator [Mycolicibact
MSTQPGEPEAWSALSSLDDPVRRRLYQLIVESDGPVSREDAAAAAGIGRTLAAYHLDKLSEAHLLTVAYRRPEGRTGPGAGRPAKLYSPVEREFSVSVPPRDYRLLADVLASSIERDPDGTVSSALHQAARGAGESVATEAGGDLLEALHASGYLPYDDERGGIGLRNCPFHAVAKEHLEVVCGLNLALVEGVITGSSTSDARAELIPRDGHCCVRIHRQSG